MDKQMDTLTMEEFKKQLKVLLRRASDSGLDVDELCELAELVLQSYWSE